MHPALTRRNGVRDPGGARGSDGNLADLAHSKWAACAFDSRLPYSIPSSSTWQQRLGLVQEVPSSNLGRGTTPPRTACGSAFVRRMIRVDTGGRLLCARAATGRRARLRGVYLRVRIPPGVRTSENRAPIGGASRQPGVPSPGLAGRLAPGSGTGSPLYGHQPGSAPGRGSISLRGGLTAFRGDVYVRCGQGPEWNGKTLVLQLDHENGDCTDNRLENLRFLCPNCHSQTETFCRGMSRRGSVGNGVIGNTPGFGPGDGSARPGSNPGSPATSEAA
jgi:hypothetical protein